MNNTDLISSLIYFFYLFGGLFFFYIVIIPLFKPSKKNKDKSNNNKHINGLNPVIFKVSESLTISPIPNKKDYFSIKLNIPNNRGFIIDSINYKKYTIKNNYSDSFIYNINNPQFENGYENFMIIKDILNPKLKYKINLNYVFDELINIKEIIITYPTKLLKKGDLLKSNTQIEILNFTTNEDEILDLKENIELAIDEIEREKIRKSLLNKTKKKNLKIEVEEELIDEGLIVKKNNNNKDW